MIPMFCGKKKKKHADIQCFCCYPPVNILFLMEKSTVKLYKTHKSRSFPKTTMDVYRFIVFVGCWRRSVHISGQRAMTPGRAGPFQPGGRLAHSPGPKSPVRCQLLIHTLPCIYIYRNIHTCVIYTYNCICICMYYTHIYIYIYNVCLHISLNQKGCLVIAWSHLRTFHDPPAGRIPTT